MRNRLQRFLRTRRSPLRHLQLLSPPPLPWSASRPPPLRQNSRPGPRRQKCIARACRSEPSHVVEGELISARGIGHLRKAAAEVVGVIHGRGVRIGFLRQAIQTVVSVANELVLSVCLVEKIADRVVVVSFDVTRWEGCLRDAAKRVRGERCCVVVRILDAGQIVFRIVAIRRDVIRRIGDRGQAVGIVVGVRRCFAILIGNRCATAFPTIRSQFNSPNPHSAPKFDPSMYIPCLLQSSAANVPHAPPAPDPSSAASVLLVVAHPHKSFPRF